MHNELRKKGPRDSLMPRDLERYPRHIRADFRHCEVSRMSLEGPLRGHNGHSESSSGPKDAA